MIYKNNTWKKDNDEQYLWPVNGYDIESTFFLSAAGIFFLSAAGIVIFKKCKSLMTLMKMIVINLMVSQKVFK